MMKFFLSAIIFLISLPLFSQVNFENAVPNLTFNFPVDIQSSGTPGDNRLFVVEQAGRIKVFNNQSNTGSSSTFLNITSKVNYTPGQEKGLLGLAFHPNYQNNGFFYVAYTGFDGGLIRVIVERYTVSGNPNQASFNSGCQVIAFTKNQSNSNHNGSSLAFGPDGHLYLSSGDGGGGGDPQRNAQNVNSLFGKILRLDINTSCPGYNIPSGNPFVGSNGRNEIYAYGLRNTWRMSFDFQTGRLWGADVGQGQTEEINLIRNGRNYGWRYYEGFNVFNSSDPAPSNPEFPIYTYNHNQGDQSITGGYVYRGSEIGAQVGRYIFGDFVSGRIWSLSYNAGTGATNRTQLFNTSFNISCFGQDINRELYFADYSSGRIYKFGTTNTPPPPPPPSNPTSGNCSFSASGCTITMSGLNQNRFIKIFNSSFQVVWSCSPFSGSPCSSTETYTATTSGTYFVQRCDGILTEFTLSGCGGTNPPPPPPPTTNPTTPTTAGGCTFSSSGCTITMSGLNQFRFVKIFNASFQEVWSCSPFSGSSCSSTETFTASSAGTYFAQACDGTLLPYNLTNCSSNGGNTGGNTGTSGCNVSTQNCTINFSGLSSNDFVKVFDASFNVIWTCNPFNGNSCNQSESVSGLNNGTYYVEACNQFEPYQVSGCGSSSGSPCANQGGDSDGDGVCNNQDCEPTNPSLPASPGSSCNDFNPNTINDAITSNGCDCVGTPTSNNGGCAVTPGNCSFTLTGLNSSDFVKIFNASFQVVWTCNPFNGNPCTATEIPTGFTNGTYFIQSCDELEPYTLNGCSGGGNNNTGNGGCNSTFNVASGKSTQQSSTFSTSGITGSSSKAVDGNTNGTFFTNPSSNSSVAVTRNESRPFWQVDLQSNHLIENIRIYNRLDGTAKTTNAYVLVSDQPFTSSNLNTARSQADYEFFISGTVGSPSTISPNTTGRYVRVQMQNSGFLTLAEVEVIGCTSNNFVTTINNTLTENDISKDDLEIQAIESQPFDNWTPPTQFSDINSFVAYPNPARDELNINLSSINGQPALIQIYDINGQLIKQQNVDKFASETLSLELTGMDNGLYLISVQLENNKRISQPFTIMK